MVGTDNLIGGFGDARSNWGNAFALPFGNRAQAIRAKRPSQLSPGTELLPAPFPSSYVKLRVSPRTPAFKTILEVMDLTKKHSNVQGKEGYTALLRRLALILVNRVCCCGGPTRDFDCKMRFCPLTMPSFRRKAKKRMLELMGGGATVLFVNHGIVQVKEMCSQAVWPESGVVKAAGFAEEVCRQYACAGGGMQ